MIDDEIIINKIINQKEILRELEAKTKEMEKELETNRKMIEMQKFYSGLLRQEMDQRENRTTQNQNTYIINGAPFEQDPLFDVVLDLDTEEERKYKNFLKRVAKFSNRKVKRYIGCYKLSSLNKKLRIKKRKLMNKRNLMMKRNLINIKRYSNNFKKFILKK